MGSSSFNKELIINILDQIHQAIEQLIDWNSQINNPYEYGATPEGTKTLAASSMLLEAIGEGIKKIHKLSPNIFSTHPEIPWHEIMGMRNHIAHGYFDIDEEEIFYVIKNELTELDGAVASLKAAASRRPEIDHLTNSGIHRADP